jgi:DNA primase
MRFPQAFIDDLRRQADIVRLISDYVTLKKKGANWMACCPFHQEKSPSFSVSPSKEIFYCFGCGKGGSIFNFVMEAEHVTFPEAIRIVAEKTGMPLPATVDDKRFEAKRKESDEVIELNTWALEFWEQQLQESPEARLARDYLTGRAISEQTLKTFRLGYSPNSWEALGNYLKSRGASVGQIERSGLVVKKEQGGYYDRFRGRVIFPVMDAQGKPVAFGARAIRPEDEPKYLNSPETAAYTKGRHLYGLNITRNEIRRKKFVILVEGYLDLIVPYQFGIENVVASLGTALTTEQARLLSRFARKVVVNYDGDRAGIQAAKRAIETLLAEDLEIKVLVLPEGADPDDFLRQRGAEEYNKRRGEAAPYIQFVIEQSLRDRDLRVPAHKAEAVEEVLPYIRAVKNRIQKREYFDIAMDALRVEGDSLRQELWRAVRAAGPQAQAPSDTKRKVLRASAGNPTVAEKRLLELLVHDAELRSAILGRLEESEYETLPTAPIFRALKTIEESHAEISFELLKEMIGEDPAANYLPEIWMTEPERAEGEAIDSFMTDAESCVAALNLMRIDRVVKELAFRIAAADREGDVAKRDRLIMEDVELKRRRTALLPGAVDVTGGVRFD